MGAVRPWLKYIKEINAINGFCAVRPPAHPSGIFPQYLKELPPRNSRSSDVGGSWRLGTGAMYFRNFSRR